MSILSSIYYIRLVRFLFFNNFKDLKPIFSVQISKVHVWLIVFTFLFNIFFFCFQDIIILYFDDLFFNYLLNEFQV